jgi:hypothetical protein
MGGVLAINELIDVKVRPCELTPRVSVRHPPLPNTPCPRPLSLTQLSGDDAAKTHRLTVLLSRTLEDSEDFALTEAAARTLGHLVRTGGALTSDIVEKEVRDQRGGMPCSGPWA